GAYSFSIPSVSTGIAMCPSCVNRSLSNYPEIVSRPNPVWTSVPALDANDERNAQLTSNDALITFATSSHGWYRFPPTSRRHDGRETSIPPSWIRVGDGRLRRTTALRRRKGTKHSPPRGHSSGGLARGPRTNVTRARRIRRATDI